VSLRVEQRGAVAVLTLDRPEVRNAFDGAMIDELGGAFRQAAGDDAIRAVILQAAGEVFSAGADLAWMQRMAEASPEENLADARRLAQLMRLVDTCPMPVIARVQGTVLAGAVGLIACCDIAIAADKAEFGLSEVRLGLIPAVIAPYVVRAIGPRAARRLFLTAERIKASEALRLGLVHESVPASGLDDAVARHIVAILAGGPAAQAAAKKLVADVARPIDEALIEETARRIAAIRATAEAHEGLGAFLEKRKAKWVQEPAR
jgi:methylglutaconyl-CoA hydratase